ncbi:MAG: 7-cyano-7-deazaguanine synthase QueC [Candidatus Cloacimonetes bacterium HGW-Cloacimonetes-3]|jgi:7-cyano-7-deazaguanine synthase|nr:MAG: 7-cyano-7-deazaguanine synthase QueC [Candidatus Cloacimonetes bacterium HGW-Cloacimonetes-3]
MNRAIVLVSGGMDSLVCAASAAVHCDEINFLHFSYGQRTQEKELACFEALVQHYSPERAKVVDYHWLREIGGSALTDTSHQINTHGVGTEIPNTYVPFRNATLLCAAVAWAEVIDANSIYIGAVEEDSSGYPDCREEFFKDFSAAVASGSKKGSGILIETPVLHLSKAEIVNLGMKLDAPFHLSWSCYADNNEACCVCDSCHLRKQAFAAAGYTDPIKYRLG